MNMKISKVTLSILVIILAVSFVVSNIVYGKVNDTIKARLTQIIQRQSAEIKKLTNQVLEKQKELESTKNELDKANKKISALTTATPEAVTK